MENDFAQDLLGDFNDAKDISVLENSLDAVCELKDSDFLDAPTAAQAIATACLIKVSNEIKPEDKDRLKQKVDKALARVLERSEAKDLWQESSEYDEWVKSVQELIQF